MVTCCPDFFKCLNHTGCIFGDITLIIFDREQPSKIIKKVLLSLLLSLILARFFKMFAIHRNTLSWWNQKCSKKNVSTKNCSVRNINYSRTIIKKFFKSIWKWSSEDSFLAKKSRMTKTGGYISILCSVSFRGKVK